MNKETNLKNTTIIVEDHKSFSECSMASQKVDFEKEEMTCRICMERESPSLRLINPCRCRGSMKYVHEECLKTWLVSQNPEIEKGQCELCKTDFKMEIKVKKKCSPMNLCRDAFNKCLSVPLCLTVLGMLFIVLYLIYEKFFEFFNGDIDIFTLILVDIFLFFGLFIVLLILNAIRESCISTYIAEWTIHNQIFEESTLKDNSNINENEERNLSALIMVLPKKITVRGRKVCTPYLRPPMTPLIRRNGDLAYTPAAYISSFQTFQNPMISIPAHFEAIGGCNSVPN